MRKNKLYYKYCKWGIYTYFKFDDIKYNIWINNDGSIEFVDPISDPINPIILHTSSIQEMNMNHLFNTVDNKLKLDNENCLIIKKLLLNRLNKILKLMVFS